MNDSVSVPRSIWREVSDFFAALFAPCKDCVRGNVHQCWNANCSAFKFRTISRRVASVSTTGGLSFARWVAIENEILNAVRHNGGPIPPQNIKLNSTHSKAVKSATISRLVKQGRLVETRTGKHTRLISLPKKEN